VVELVESVLADDPEHLRALSMLAAAHWQRGKLAWLRGDGVPEEELGAGAAAARKATELYPSDVQGHSTLGLVLLELASSQMQSGIDPSEAADEAAAAFARAAMLTPESAGPVVNEAMVHVVRAQYLIGQGEEISDERAERAAQLLDQAEQLLQHALRLEPSSSWVQRTMAEVLWYRGQLVAADEEQCALTDQAVAHLRRCVESRPTDGSCWQYLLQCRGVQRWCVGQLGDGRTADDVAATIRDEADAAYAAVPQLDTPAMRRWVEELAAGNNAGS
jgi:tetratricopeptide (TPR) repeat protein